MSKYEPIPVSEIVRALESEAANTDTDPRWLAASELRRMDCWETRTLMCRTDERPSTEEATLLGARSCAREGAVPALSVDQIRWFYERRTGHHHEAMSAIAGELLALRNSHAQLQAEFNRLSGKLTVIRECYANVLDAGNKALAERDGLRAALGCAET